MIKHSLIILQSQDSLSDANIKKISHELYKLTQNLDPIRATMTNNL